MGSKLWDALVLVREGEMCKHVRADGGGRHCAVGFVEKVWFGRSLVPGFRELVESGKNSDLLRDLEVLGETMNELFPERVPIYFKGQGVAWEYIAPINNHPDTVKADLELAFEKAAIRRDELVA